MKKFLLIALFFSLSLSAAEGKKKLYIITYSLRLPYITDPLKDPTRFTKIRENFEIIYFSGINAYVRDFKGDDPSIHKYIFFDLCHDPRVKNMPKQKTICFRWEPFGKEGHWYDYYSRVYTYEDNLIENKRFFKLYYPVLQERRKESISFDKKHLLVMVASRWNKERIQLLDFFAPKPVGSLHVYGRLTGSAMQYYTHPLYQGGLRGYPSGEEKLKTLAKYRFCLCFENTHSLPGYITEKIFDAFAAGCVPVYWGPDNVEMHIPKECFIDYRKFKNNDEMLQTLTSMKEEEYNKYLENIKLFLKSEKAKLFSVEQFEKTLTEAVFS